MMKIENPLSHLKTNSCGDIKTASKIIIKNLKITALTNDFAI